LRYILLTISLIAAIIVAYWARHILLAALLGFVLANLLYHLGDWTARHTGSHRVVWTSIYFLLGLGILAAIGLFGTPAITEQASAFGKNLTDAIDASRNWLEQRAWGQRILEANEDGSGMGQRMISLAETFLGGIWDSLGGLAVVVVVMVYGAYAPRPYRDGVIWLVPERWEQKARALLSDISVTMVWWTIGRAASMTVVGITTWLGLWLLGTPAPLVLGFIAGLLSFIPNLGPLLSVVPAIMVASTVGLWHVVWVALLYIGIQLVESNVITPLIQREAVTVPPAMLIVFQLIMGVLAGVWGMIVATPLLVILMLIVQSLYVRDYLHKPGPLVSEEHGDGSAQYG
jgi:predicted PurR-regulated permease PerM